MCSDTRRLAGQPSRIPVGGALGAFTAEFRKALTTWGFCRHTVADHTRLMADASAWLSRQGLEPGELTVERVAAFLADHRAAGRTVLVSARGAAPLLGFLRSRDVIPPESTPPPAGPVDALLAQYLHMSLEESRCSAVG